MPVLFIFSCALFILAGCEPSSPGGSNTGGEAASKSGPTVVNNAASFEPELPLARPDNNKGASIYKEACTGCHGASGDGRGPATSYTRFEPTDFTDDTFRASADLHHVYSVVSSGRPLAVMPAFRSRYSSADLWNVSSYIFSFGTRTSSLKLGKELYEKHCLSCHGVKGDGKGGIMASSKDLFSFADHRAMAGKRRLDARRVVEVGDNELSMPAFGHRLTSQDVVDVTDYVFLFSYEP